MLAAQKDANMGQIYQLQVGAVAEDLNTTGVKIRIPCCESIKVVEYGFLSVATDPGSTGVVKLQYIDCAGNTVDLDSFTVPAAATVNDLVSQRVDVLVDKSLNEYTASVSGTPGTKTAEADGFGCVQLNVTTALGASVTGTPYIKYALAGSPKTATGTTQVTSV
jgi:hypothetical protein